MNKILPIFMLMMLSGCLQKAQTAYDQYPSDNFLEEIAEHAIEAYTGIDLDLSPFSEE